MRLNQLFFTSTFIILLTLKPQSVQAVDPVTAAAVVKGVSVVTSALKKPQPDLTLEIVKRNRELLKGMNTKLDQLGDNLIKLHAVVGDIPEKLADELDKERIYKLGVGANAYGMTLLDSIRDYESELKITSPAGLSEVEKYHQARLNLLEGRIAVLGNEIIQEPSIRNIDAITLALVAHSHLSILTETTSRFGLRKRYLENKAKDYQILLKEVITNHKGTLANWTSNRFKALLSRPDWKKISDEFNIPSLSWSEIGELPLQFFQQRSFDQCITRIHWTDNINDIKFFIRKLKLENHNPIITTNESVTDCSNTMPVITFTSKQRIHTPLDENGELQVFITGDEPENCLNECGLKEQKETLKNLMPQLQVIDSSTRILAALGKLHDSAEAVAVGDYSGFQISNTLDSIAIYRDTIRKQVDAHEKLARLEELEILSEERSRVTNEVSGLIRKQDQELAALFQKATKAAKFNKTLGYIRLAANVYHTWTKLEGKFSKGEKKATANVIKAAKAGIIEEQRREPASAALIEPAVKLLVQLEKMGNFYGDLAVAKQAHSRFDQAFTEASNSIPFGAEQSYDLYYSKNDRFIFRFMVPAGEDILEPDVGFKKTIILKGTGRGVGGMQAIDTHIDILGL